MSSETRFLQQALKAADCGCWVWRIPENSLDWDDTLFKIYGLSRGEFSSNFEAWASTVHPEDLGPATEALNKAVSGEAKFDTMFRILKGPEKEIRWIGAKAVLERDSEGRALVAIGVNWDCTEEQILRQQNQERSEFVGHILDSLSDPICVYSDNNEIVFTNVAFCNFFGVLQCDLKGEVLFGEVAEVLNICIYKAREIRLFELNRGQREMLVRVTETMNPADNKKLKVFTFHDLTEKRQLERKMIFSSKMASLGQMAGGIAHEINNPLTAARNNLYLIRRILAKSNSVDPSVFSKFELIENGFDRTKKIVSALLTFSRQSGSVPLEKISCKEVIDEVAILAIDRLKRSDVLLKVECPENIQVYARKTDLSQAILNIVNNSCDACVGQDLREVRIQVAKMGEDIRIAIEDSGPGIPIEISEKILEPFFSTKAAGQGTGLGLSICRELVMAMGGILSIENLKPARFVILLPSEKNMSGVA